MVECSLTVRKVMGSIPGRVILYTVKVGTRCHPAKHSVFHGRIEGKWCKALTVAKEKGAFWSPSLWRSTNLLTCSFILK